jgi:hypothetical protein
MLHYLLDYGSFLLGSILYILGKIQEYKAMAKANPDPKIVYDRKHFIEDEWINFARILIGGIALVIFMPMLIGGATVDIKSAEGNVITNIEMKTILAPFYFLVGYSGSSGLFAVLGKYKKTLFNRVGVDDKQ